MKMETAIEVAARIWCDPEMSSIEMDVELAMKIAQLLSGPTQLAPDAASLPAIDGLGKQYEELLELAEELIGYPSEYFQKKWRFRERLDDLRSRLIGDEMTTIRFGYCTTCKCGQYFEKVPVGWRCPRCKETVADPPEPVAIPCVGCQKGTEKENEE